MKNLPNNVIREGTERDDTGREVLITTYGTDINENRKCVLWESPGTVVWGPYKTWYVAQHKVKSKNDKYDKMVPKKFVTEPYWCVYLKKLDMEMQFQENEIRFIDGVDAKAELND